MLHRLLLTPGSIRIFFLGVATLFFFGFGWYHLALFETTDEHLWKYDRIGNYWEAVRIQNWEATYINDKPGITVALISGIGLLTEPHPERNELRPLLDDTTRRFETYNPKQSVLTNFTFRLPVLLFSLLGIVFFYLLACRALPTKWGALFATLFVATNPLLIGMAQIINPDSFFWIFGSLAVLAYLITLKEPWPRWILLAGLLTGFALLSKYTAFLLFLLYGVLLVLTGVRASWPLRKWGTHIWQLGAVFAISVFTFALFLPAVFKNPQYIFKGLSQFLTPLILFSGIAAILLLACASFLIYRFWLTSFTTVYKKGREALPLLTRVLAVLFLFLFFISLVNVWTGQKIVPVDALRDAAYANEPQAFNFRPILSKSVSDWEKLPKLFLMNSYPLVFTLSPLFLLILCYGLFQAAQRKNILGKSESILVSSFILFIFIYLWLTLEAKVVTNVRYLIVLYPLLALLVGVFLNRLVEARHWGKFDSCKQALTALAIIGYGFFIVFLIRPFYFSYESHLLPQQYSVHDSWGHGSYEAAQYLNTLPHPENLIIWSNSDTVCRFFVGKCLRSRHIDLSAVTPDYFVLSKRGTIKERNHFLLENNPVPSKDARYYIQNLEKDAVWSLLINGRSDNAIRIIPYEKE